MVVVDDRARSGAPIDGSIDRVRKLNEKRFVALVERVTDPLVRPLWRRA